MTTTDDTMLIKKTLERLAEAADDITPQVYEVFFSIRPKAEELFVSKFDMALGHMLNEVLFILLDQTKGKTYLDNLMQGYVSDHDSMGVKDMGMYKDFLTALRTTIVEVLGESWPQDEKEAFNRQCDLMGEHLILAEQALIDRKILSAASRQSS